MKSLILESPAKLNLYLEILNKRSDGFHNVKTVLERIGLYDEITLVLRKDSRIILRCDNKSVSEDASNLAYQAALLLQEKSRKKLGVTIRIKKRIPVACGLGGGSSNAATVLLGLNRIWKLGLKKEGLAGIAQNLGSDVPFFVYERPFVLGSGRGEKITPLTALKHKFWHILAVPPKEIPTKLAYKIWDKNKTIRLTKELKDIKIITLALRKKDLNLLSKTLFNSFNTVAERICPQVLTLKKRLRGLGVEAISMSGKGPAVFGIVSSRKEAESAVKQLKARQDWFVYAVRTI